MTRINSALSSMKTRTRARKKNIVIESTLTCSPMAASSGKWPFRRKSEGKQQRWESQSSRRRYSWVPRSKTLSLTKCLFNSGHRSSARSRKRCSRLFAKMDLIKSIENTYGFERVEHWLLWVSRRTSTTTESLRINRSLTQIRLMGRSSWI